MPANAHDSSLHKGWYSRGYIPHFDQPGLMQGITFRLHDSMPAERRAEWEEFLHMPDLAAQRARIQIYLDAGYGSCVLHNARIAEIVQAALRYFDGERYYLLAWVVMPNHVHALVEIKRGYPLASIVHSWKSYTAKRVNQATGHTGAFWHRDYFDRYTRDERHLERAVQYVHANPVMAGLVERADAWPFSSARLVDALDAALRIPGEQPV